MSEVVEKLVNVFVVSTFGICYPSKTYFVHCLCRSVLQNLLLIGGVGQPHLAVIVLFMIGS